ncbi:glycosyltransferase family 39 protein [Candidatus Margulisiibacteriota bacterium]
MKKVVWVLLIIILALGLRFWGLGNVNKLYFDEVLNVYEALKYHEGLMPLDRESQAVPRHPMLAAVFIELGLSWFGFDYLGWRFFSVLAGAFSVAALFLLARELFSLRAALLSAGLLAINFLHLVLSRAAMVDSYLVCFLLFGFYFLARSLKRTDSKYLLLAGTFFGLSLATKWVALLSLLSVLAIYFLISRDPKKVARGLAQLLLFPVLIFLLASLYFNLSAGMTPLSWAQFEINNFLHHRQFSYVHPHTAPAWSWPFLLKATPFHSSDVGKDMVRVVVAFGNPAVYWVMLPVLAYLVYAFRKKRQPALLFVLIGFFGFYLPWLIYQLLALTPMFKTRTVFFYYFMPAIPFYLMGLSYVLDNLLKDRRGRVAAGSYLALVLGLFFYFSPIIYGLPIKVDQLYRLIWLKGWI